MEIGREVAISYTISSDVAVADPPLYACDHRHAARLAGGGEHESTRSSGVRTAVSLSAVGCSSQRGSGVSGTEFLAGWRVRQAAATMLIMRLGAHRPPGTSARPREGESPWLRICPVLPAVCSASSSRLTR